MIFALAVSHDLLSHLSHVWGYVSLGVSTVLAEEAAPVLAGFAAHQGHLDAGRAMLACALGSWLGDVALYCLGRTRAASTVTRWHWLAAPAERLLGVVGRHPWRASVATRFAYGARLILPITCGTARVRIRTYLIGSGASALVWSVLFTALGWTFGRTAVELVGEIRRHEDLIAIALVVAVSAGAWLVARRNKEHVFEGLGGAAEAAAASAATGQSE